MEFSAEVIRGVGTALVWAVFISAVGGAVLFFVGRGRAGYVFLGIHLVSLLSSVVLLVWLLVSCRFEFYYVWEHSARDLPVAYRVAGLWEGQEGSFLVWMVWQAVVVMLAGWWWRGRAGYSVGMGVGMLAQVLLSSMLLGVQVGGELFIGKNPFVLLREELSDVHIFQTNPDFVPPDGTGINVLLLNWWMLVHPPVLFAGYASLLLPFMVGVAAVAGGAVREWVGLWRRTLLLGVAVLGAGILFGSMWAYEALSFGGFWAWDPVENASLMPWVVALAALHTTYIFQVRGKAGWSALFFTFVAYLLTHYASFLTRSGILADTSVHAFTDMGLGGQLVFTMGVLGGVAVGVLWKARKALSSPDEGREPLLSREFWMLTGAYVLFISFLQLFVDTSRPVWNALFGLQLAPPPDPISYYNRMQLPVAVLLSLFSGFALFLVFKRAVRWRELMPVGVLLLVCGGCGLLLLWVRVLTEGELILLFVCSLFGCLASLWYIVVRLRGRWQQAGGALAHAGFMVFLIGVVFAGGKRQTLTDVGGQALPQDDPMEGNVILYRGIPEPVKDGWTAHFVGEDIGTGTRRYIITLKRGERTLVFQPQLVKDKEGRVAANPSIVHSLFSDLYLYVAAAPNLPDTIAVERLLLGRDETAQVAGMELTLGGVEFDTAGGHLRIYADVLARVAERLYRVRPSIVLFDTLMVAVPDTIGEGLAYLSLVGIDTFHRRLVMEVAVAPSSEWVVVRVYRFPLIVLVWAGGALTVLGSLLSFWNLRGVRPQKIHERDTPTPSILVH